MQGSTLPLVIRTIPQDLRSASFRVVLVFFAEMALFVILTLIGGDGMKRFKTARNERLQTQEEKGGKKKNHGSKGGQGPVEDEEETITLNKKPVAAEEVIEGTSFADQKVAFPPIAEVPSLESLSKKAYLC